MQRPMACFENAVSSDKIDDKSHLGHVCLNIILKSFFSLIAVLVDKEVQRLAQKDFITAIQDRQM